MLRHLSWLLPCLVMLITGCGRLGYTLLAQQSDPAGGPSGAGDDGAGDGDGDRDGEGELDGDEADPAADAGLDAGADAAAGDTSPDAALREPEERSFADACDFDALAVVQDGVLIDDAAGAILRTTQITRCLNLGRTRSVSQDDPGVLDPDSGRLLIGPEELVLAAGGPAQHRALAYLDERAMSPIVRNDVGDDRYELAESASGRIVLSVPTSTITLGHEYAVVMMCHEPIGNTTMLSVYGFEGMGTTAGARWFGDAPIDTAKHWYVVEWTDSDGSGDPGDGDTFTVIDSG